MLSSLILDVSEQFGKSCRVESIWCLCYCKGTKPSSFSNAVYLDSPSATSPNPSKKGGGDCLQLSFMHQQAECHLCQVESGTEC